MVVKIQNSVDFGSSAEVSKSVKIKPLKLIFYFKKNRMVFDICQIFFSGELFFVLTFFEAMNSQKNFPIGQNISNLARFSWSIFIRAVIDHMI